MLIVRHWPKKWLKKGQIVIGNYSNITAISQHDLKDNLYIKRVYGLPGESLSVHISQLWDDNIRDREKGFYNADGYRNWNIPLNSYFVKGDGPGGDSLLWGPIPLASFQGLAILQLRRKAE